MSSRYRMRARDGEHGDYRMREWTYHGVALLTLLMPLILYCRPRETQHLLIKLGHIFDLFIVGVTSPY